MSEELAVITVHADRGDPIRRFISPTAPLRTIWRHHELLRQLARREIVGRYRGSYLGILWALLTPLMTLAVFTLVFGAMGRHAWAGSSLEGKLIRPALEYPMNLFMGIIMYSVFSEVVGRASTMITTNPNFVKKAVFPLELLGVSAVIASLVHAAMTLVIQMLVIYLAVGYIPWTILLLPLMFVPAALVTLGVSWALAAMGVFFRDLGQAVGPVVQLLFFLTPIVYPMARFAEFPLVSRTLTLLNPFVTIVENARLVAIEGQMPHWASLGWVTLASGGVAMAGYILFMKVRRYFADAM